LPHKKTVELRPAEIKGMIEIFDTLNIKEVPFHGVCSKSTAEISTLALRYEPAYTLLSVGSGFQFIVDGERMTVLRLFARVHVPLTTDGTSIRSKATIESSSCEMSPAKWTITFDDGQ